MKNWLVLFYLLVGSSAIAQSIVYQAFEADSAAEPRGGVTAFNTFLQVNLQKPILAESKGIGGIVVLSGIVEIDGHVSNVTITKSVRPDCDREALRVFNLFRAWKPALKDSKAVRQQISMPIVFKPNTPFIYDKGEHISYLDADINLLLDSNERVKFKHISPLDTNSLPNGDLVIYKLSNKKWEEYARDSLVYQRNGQVDLSGQPIYFLGHQLALLKLKGDLYTVDANRKRMTKNSYEVGKLFGPQFVYHANGGVAEKKEYSDNKEVIISWYANGQIRQIQEIITGSSLEPRVLDKITALWDSTGQQLIKAGNGWATLNKVVKSYKDKTLETSLVEQGAYKDNFKQGKWIGRYADDSYYYEEQYDKGILIAGKSRLAGQDMVAYEMEDQPPTFPGGLKGLGQFLNQNLRYPENARLASVQGQVWVSFIVCTDGTLCDYMVIKGVQSDIDREALRVVKKMSGRWTSGIQRGKKVRVKYNLPINFTLN